MGTVEKRLILRGALVLENADDQIRRPVPRLTAVEIGQIVVEGDHRRGNAFFAERVEGVEIVGEPVADRAVLTDTAGNHREVAAVRFVIERERLDGRVRGRAADAATLPTGFVTFLFSDIEDSTGLVRHLGDRYERFLGEVRRLLRSSIAAANAGSW